MRKQLASLFLTLICLTSSACGGGTIGTGLGTRGAEFAGFTGRANEPLSFTLRARIVNVAGKPQANTTLRVISSVGSFSCVTTNEGTCGVGLRVMAGERVSLSIHKQGIQYASQEYLSPAGQSQISRTFIVQPDRSIEAQEP